MQRRIHLDEHVGRVDAGEWAARSNECVCLVWLSDRERYTVLSHLLPYADWPTRFVLPVGGNEYELAADAEYQQFQVELADLVVKLTGGDAMGCNQSLADALNAMALAIRTSGGSGTGAGCASGQSAILNCLGQYTDDQILDTPAEGVDPQGETYPDGFDSMADYLLYKCQLAHAIYDDLVFILRGMQAYAVVLNKVDGAIAYLAGLLTNIGAISIGPSASARMAEDMVKMLNLAPNAFVVLDQALDYLSSNKTDIICQLYLSSAPAEAVAYMSGRIDDMLQAIEWEETFGEALGEKLGTLFGDLMAAVEGNGLVNNLFRLELDFVYADEVECGSCGGWTLEWHFDNDLEGWTYSPYGFEEGDTFTAQWVDGETAADPNDQSPGRFAFSIDTVNPHGGCGYLLDLDLDAPTVIPSGYQISVDVNTNNSDYDGFDIFAYYDDFTQSEANFPNVGGGSWEPITMSLTAGKTLTQLRVRFGVGETADSRNGRIDNIRIEPAE